MSRPGERTPSVVRPPAWAVASATTALVALLAGWLIAGAVQPPGYDPVRQTISVLAGGGAAHRWIMTVGLYAVGACHLITAAGLRGLRTGSRLLLAVGGIGGLGLAVFAQPAHGSATAHIAFTTLGFVALALWPTTVARRGEARFPLRPRDAVLAGVVSLVLLGWLAQALTGSMLGLAERVLTAQQTGWPLLVVLALRNRAGQDRAPAAAPAGRMER